MTNSEPQDKDIITLTDDQKKKIVDLWNSRLENPPSIKEMVKIAFPDVERAEGRTKHGRAIRDFLATQGKKAATTVYTPKGLIELTDEQKEFIERNPLMKPLELARAIFSNPVLAITSQEARSVTAYTNSYRKVAEDPEDAPEQDYKAPNTIDRVIARIERYNSDIRWDVKKLTSRQKKQCLALMSYLNTYRFAHHMNTFEDPSDRILFESTFIKYTYDKDDLTKEDVDQYILLSNDVVHQASIQRTINLLQAEQDRTLAEEGRLSVALVDAVKNARSEYNECVKRQQSLYKDLTKKRSDRLNEASNASTNIATLIQLWREEETRKQIIAIADQRKETLKDDLDKMETMDDLKLKFVGISKEEILNA